MADYSTERNHGLSVSVPARVDLLTPPRGQRDWEDRHVLDDFEGTFAKLCDAFAAIGA